MLDFAFEHDGRKWRLTRHPDGTDGSYLIFRVPTDTRYEFQDDDGIIEALLYDPYDCHRTLETPLKQELAVLEVMST